MKKYREIVVTIFCILTLISCSSAPRDISSSIIPSSTSNSKPFSKSLAKIVKNIKQKNFIAAEANFNLLKKTAASDDEIALVKITEGLLLKAKGDYEGAIKTLTDENNQALFSLASEKVEQKKNTLLAELYMATGSSIDAAKVQFLNTQSADSTEQELRTQFDQLWHLLKQVDITTLDKAIAQETNPMFRSWMELAKIVNNANFSLSKQIGDLDQWQNYNQTHPAALIPPKEVEDIRIAYLSTPQKIAVILPFDGKYQAISEAIRDGFISSYYQQGISEVHFYNADPEMAFLPIYEQVVSEGADLIVGPLLKEQLENLYQLRKLPVKTLALNQINRPNLPNLVQFSLSADHEIDSLIAYAENKQYNRAIVIASSADWAQSNGNKFSRLWRQKGHTLIEQAKFTQTRELSHLIRKMLKVDTSIMRASNLKGTIEENLEYESIRRTDIDFAVIFAKPHEALAIPPLFNFYYASELPILGTSSMFNGVSDRKSNKDLNGVMLTEQPLVVNPPYNLPNKYNDSSLIRMFAFGKDAFAIGERIGGMKNFNDLQGATGSLSLNNNIISRKLNLAIFERGELRVPNKI